jgi:hypothetical protein
MIIGAALNQQSYDYLNPTDERAKPFIIIKSMTVQPNDPGASRSDEVRKDIVLAEALSKFKNSRGEL